MALDRRRDSPGEMRRALRDLLPKVFPGDAPEPAATKVRTECGGHSPPRPCPPAVDPDRGLHRGSGHFPWRTILSFYYVGESGGPFTYLAFGGGRRGDLNADGSNANDPIYVPRDALDSDEIAFTGLSNTPGADNSSAVQAERVDEQRAAFERFIDRTGCLRRWRGRILERNGCREPWSHTTILSVRQAIPIGGHALEVGPIGSDRRRGHRMGPGSL